MKSRKKAAYLSTRSVKRALYKKMLAARYQLMFIDNIFESELVVMPIGIEGPAKEQERDSKLAAELKIPCISFGTELLEEAYAAMDQYVTAQAPDKAEMGYELEI